MSSEYQRHPIMMPVYSSRCSVVRMIILVVALILGILETPAQPTQAFRPWYIIFNWEGSSGVTRGADILVLQRDGSMKFVAHGNRVVGHWVYDSTSERFNAIVQDTRYSFGVGDSSIYGNIVIGKEKGYIDGQSAPFAEWNKLMEDRRKRDSQRGRPRLSIEHTSLPLESSALSIGFVTAPMRTSFNGELAGVRVMRKDGTTYCSSNSIFAALSVGAFLVLKEAGVSEKYQPIAAAPAILYMITNFDVSIPISGSTLCLDLAQSTDYFFFYKLSRIVTESRAGFLIDLQSIGVPLQFSAMLCQPWMKGYRDNHDMYLAGRIGWVIR